MNKCLLNKFFNTFCISAISFILSFSASASPVNILDITKNVIEAALDNPFGNYLNYGIHGICVWGHWGWLGPYTTTTLEVNEFLPDAVITVYNGYGQNPWFYAQKIIDPAAHELGQVQAKTDYGTSSASSGNDMSLKFKEVDIIGNPALLTFFNQLPFAFISSQATPFKPYYSSLSDAYLWRSPTADMLTHPQDLIPGVRTEGDLIAQWGSIFPRTGFINQMGDYKAAAVLALRAADIATNSGQSHVYIPLHSGSCGHACHVWPSHENDFNNVKFQEIYPKEDISAKKRFGVDDAGQIGMYGQDQYEKSHGNYVFVMWRHYRGCVQSDGTYLFST